MAVSKLQSVSVVCVNSLVSWIEIGESFTLHAVSLQLGTFRAFVCAFAMETYHGVEGSLLEVSIELLPHRLDTNRLRNFAFQRLPYIHLCVLQNVLKRKAAKMSVHLAD